MTGRGVTIISCITVWMYILRAEYVVKLLFSGFILPNSACRLSFDQGLRKEEVQHPLLRTVN